MSKLVTFKLPAPITQELEGTDWHLERGARHHKLYVGNHFVAIVSHGVMRDGGRGALNIRAQIRRAKQAIKSEVRHGA